MMQPAASKLAVHILAASGALAAALPSSLLAKQNSEVFQAQFDKEVYQRYYSDLPEAEMREECAALSLTRAGLTELVETYDKAIAYHAYYTLVVTPCVVRGKTTFQGRMASFVWYPTGYLAFYYPEDKDAEPDFFICKGTTDDEGIFECDAPDG